MHRQYSKDYLDLMLVFEKSLKNKKLKPFVNQEIEALPLAKTTIFDSITQKKIITGSNDIKNIENLPNDIKVILASIDAHNLAFAQEVHKNMFYTIQQNSEDRPNQFKLFIEQQTLSHEKINTFIEKINTETVITKEMLGLQELQFSLPSKTNKKEPGRNSP